MSLQIAIGGGGMRTIKSGVFRYGLIVALLYGIGVLCVGSAVRVQPAMVGLTMLTFTKCAVKPRALALSVTHKYL